MSMHILVWPCLFHFLTKLTKNNLKTTQLIYICQPCIYLCGLYFLIKALPTIYITKNIIIKPKNEPTTPNILLIVQYTSSSCAVHVFRNVDPNTPNNPKPAFDKKSFFVILLYYIPSK